MLLLDGAHEQILTGFMRLHYTDERLAQLLAHAEDGKLSYVSCCCFIGAANADHALKNEIPHGALNPEFGRHVYAARELPGGFKAEIAYQALGESEYMIGLARAMSGGSTTPAPDRDAYRRAKLIPLIRAELERRERERSSSESLQTVLSV